MAAKRNQKLPTATASPEMGVTGYEFQYVWSARRALALLRPGTKLQKIVIENVLRKHQTDDPADNLGVDLSEYHGAIAEGPYTDIVLWQMKHSSSEDLSPWTVASLCAGRKNDATRSVFGRLGTSFSALKTELSECDGNPVIRVRVASNRPLHANALANLMSIRKAAEGILATARRPTLAGVRVKLNKQAGVTFDRIVSATQLTGRIAIEFLVAIG